MPLQIPFTCRAAETTVDGRRVALDSNVIVSRGEGKIEEFDQRITLEGMSEDELGFFVPGAEYQVSFERVLEKSRRASSPDYGAAADDVDSLEPPR